MTTDPELSRRWWRDAPSLQRVAADLLAAEMASMHPGQQRSMPPWSASFDLRHDLGADSLDLMGLASALEALLQPGAAAAPPDAPLLVHTRVRDWLDAARAWLDADGSMLTFRTSGSSGVPKPCTHALALLWQETDALAALFPHRRRIVSLVPSHHIYGFLFTVLLPQRLGLGATDVIDLRGHAPGALAAQLRVGDLVVGHPQAWRAFGQGAAAPAPDVIGVTSTAPCPPEVARAVLGAGLARLVQVYGSSETAGVGWRDDADGDYTLFPYWAQGAQPAALERQGPHGAVLSVTLQDRLAWSAPGRFRPDGRIDEAVQVGGMNVFPAYVADVLQLHPDVQEASVRLMRADEGQRLKAFVVRRAGAAGDDAALGAALQAWAAERLVPAQCPAAFSFGASLPRGASGKLADWIIDRGD